MARKHLVYVHGICAHERGFSDPWFAALSPYVPSFQPGVLGSNRHEVVWSDIVNAAATELRSLRIASAAEGAVDEEAQLKQQLIETLQNRAGGELLRAMESSGSPSQAAAAMESAAGLPTIPGLNCLDDFVSYLLGDSVRSEVLRRFDDVIRPLLTAGDSIELIAHSWGTVVAYEGLRRLDGIPFTGTVRTLFTVGGALSIGHVRRRLEAPAADGAKPQVVEQWINLNALGDIVGGSLRAQDLEVDDEFLQLEPYGCRMLGRLVLSPPCAHRSYFRAGNLAVNRDLFGGRIDQSMAAT